MNLTDNMILLDKTRTQEWNGL